MQSDPVTACCFGGPMDRQIVSGEGHILRVNFLTSSDLSTVMAPDGTLALPREGRYLAKRFVFGPLLWTVWVYDGGWIEDERVERHIELAMLTMWEIARAWNGVPVAAPRLT